MDALPAFDLARPRTLAELIKLRGTHPDSRLLGGGTDLMVNIRRGIVAPRVLIDINNVTELRGIRVDAAAIEIGAAVTLSELAADPGVLQHHPVVAQAAGQIAGPTHRNMGTVGGNLALDTRCIFYNQSEWWRDANNHCLKTTGEICHVAPKSRGVCFATFSGDLAPALLTLDAEIEIAGPAGARSMPLADLYIGYARQDEPVTETRGDGKYFLALRPGEVITAVRARNPAGLRSAYDKISHPPVHRVSGDRRRRRLAARGRQTYRPAGRLHRHQSAASAAFGYRRTVRWCARRACVLGPRCSRSRSDHGDEDDFHARPLSPPRRRRAGAAVGAAPVRSVTVAATSGNGDYRSSSLSLYR